MPSWKHGCICSRLSNFCLSHSWHGSLLSSWIAKGAAASLQFLRCSMPGAIFEKDLLQVASTEETDSNDAAEGPLLMTDSEDDSEDHLQVASTEEESEKDTRRLSLGTTATGVPEEDDVLQELDESDEGEDINNVDDHSDGDGVAQASAQQGLLNAESEDDLEAPEVLKTESEESLEAAKPQISGESSDSDGESEVDEEAELRFEEESNSKNETNEVDVSNCASCTGADQSDCKWACEVATTLQTSEGSDAVNGVVQIGAADACAPQSESLEANFLPEICLHVLGFLPVQEVMKQKVRAVSSNFGCHKAWLTHLFRLVDIDTLQPPSDVPMAREWHPIEEFTTLMTVTGPVNGSLSAKRDRLLSVLRLYPDFSEGFQGCLQLWFGPSKWIVGGKHLEYFEFIVTKTFASCGRRPRRMAASSNES
ncbi:unnamed protein product [Cladocopium goreaui]|uniref:Uncharacterized protein n=1 Tax=Cladocopium goreaui TaxID=2562237 RepID=A0A9P1GRZ6_9DINO|nr:unnamed protein product [Cladocopium goreaui]